MRNRAVSMLFQLRYFDFIRRMYANFGTFVCLQILPRKAQWSTVDADATLGLGGSQRNVLRYQTRGRQ